MPHPIPHPQTHTERAYILHICGYAYMWVPIHKSYVGQKSSLKRKHSIISDRFAVANIFLLKERIRAATVGHNPKGLSQYTWYDIQ